jgi:hypothetical protein
MMAPMKPNKTNMVTILGWATFLWGGAHVVLGVFCDLPGDHWATTGAVGITPVQWIAGDAFDSNVGIAFAFQGILGILAGAGILLRLCWGRVLTLIVAGVAILWAVESLNAVITQPFDYEWWMALIPFAAVEVLFAFFAIRTLVKNRAVFSEHVEPAQDGGRPIYFWAAWASPSVAAVISLVFWLWLRNHAGVRGEKPLSAMLFYVLLFLASAVGGVTAVISLFGIRSPRNALNIIPGALLGICINGANTSYCCLAYLFEGRPAQ